MMNTNTGKELADTVTAQLGGQKIFAMAFERCVYSTLAATYHVARGLKAHGRIRWVRVTLTPADTYTVEFLAWNARAGQVKTVAEFSDVYAYALRDLVESQTGLRMTLGTLDRAREGVA
jgi:hypothetical protein